MSINPVSANSFHTVRPGETLSGIVRARFVAMGGVGGAGATRQGVAQLAKANSIRNPDRIYAGQKLDLAALNAAFGRKEATAAVTSASSGVREAVSAPDDSARIAGPQEPSSPAQWQWEDVVPADAMQMADTEPAPLPAATPASPLVPSIAEDERAAKLPIAPLAERQLALYEQNAAGASEKPAEAARALPDIVYKGVTGKMLDAMPIEPSTRTTLQRANTIVSSTLTARSLGALTSLGGPLLTVAGLIWGIFSSRQIDAAPAGDAKPVVDTKAVADAKPTAQIKVAEALD